MAQPMTAKLEDVRVPLTFIMTGLAIFVLAQGLLLSGIALLIHGTAQVPYVLTIAHLLVLGFATMIAMGVMYQLVPVALQVNIHYLPLARWQYRLYVVGVLGLTWSFYDFSAGRLVSFAAVTVAAILLFEWNLWMTIKDAARSDIRTAVASALTSLLVTVSLGLWLTLDFFSPHLGVWHERLLTVHILFGTIGWFTMLIVGFSYKLAPMFTLSHGYESKFGTFAVYGLNAGIAAASVGVLFEWRALIAVGCFVLLFGFACYGIQLKKILQKRMRKKIDPGVTAALFAIPFSFCSSVLVLVSGWISGAGVVLEALVYLVIIGWISLTILGYLYKIIPFLWWTHKYGTIIGKQKTPSLKEMLHEKRGKVWLTAMFTAASLNTASVAFHLIRVGTFGQAVFFIVSFAYAVELALVLRK
ncbi:MAG TPA: hypothetical protein VFK44_02095 [Bacillales bacterium]|nr:hypothetical protein [Bacillales bacterium]